MTESAPSSSSTGEEVSTLSQERAARNIGRRALGWVRSHTPAGRAAQQEGEARTEALKVAKAEFVSNIEKTAFSDSIDKFTPAGSEVPTIVVTAVAAERVSDYEHRGFLQREAEDEGRQEKTPVPPKRPGETLVSFMDGDEKPLAIRTGFSYESIGYMKSEVRIASLDVVGPDNSITPISSLPIESQQHIYDGANNAFRVLDEGRRTHETVHSPGSTPPQPETLPAG